MKKRILYFIQFPPPVYGVTLVNKQVFESLKINETFVKKLLKVNYSESLSDLKKINVKKMFAFLRIWLRLCHQLITFRPSYIYYTIPPAGLGFYKELLNVFTIKLFRVKPIYHLHGKGIQKSANSRFKRKIYEYCFSNSIIIHLSDGLNKTEFEGINLKKTQLYAVPNGIETVDVNTSKNEGKINLLFLSNLQESKGIFMLLDIFPKIAKLYPDVVLNIIGGFRDPGTEARFTNFIDEHKIAKNVVHWGEKQGKEKHELIAKCDIHVHPSLNDAFPLVILEAMQHGLAVIASDQGAIPEIVHEEFGFVFPTGNKEKLHDHIENLIADENLRKSMQQNAKLEFKRKYTLENFEERMSTIFKSL